MKKIILIVICTTLYTQEVMQINLKISKELALKNSLVIKIAEKNSDYAKESINEAYSSVYPQIEAFANTTRNIKKPLLISDAFPTPVEMGRDYSLAAGISLKQSIWIGGKLFTALDIAELSIEDAKYKMNISKKDLVFEVVKTFYSALLMKEILLVNKEMLVSAIDNKKNIKRLKQNSMASEFDSIKVDVFVADLEAAVLKAKVNYQTVKNTLKFLIGIDITKKIELVGDLQFIAINKIANINSVYIENRSDLKSLTINKKILTKLKKIEEANYYPSIFAFADLQRVAIANNFIPESDEQYTAFSIGIGIKIPIFNGFITSTRIEQAQINIDKIDYNIQLHNNKIKMDIENSRLMIIESSKRIESQIKSVQSATKALEIAKVRFENGLSTQQELNESETALKRTKLGKISAVYDYLIAKTIYERLLGIIK